jgi:hypothetical protein
MGQHTLGSNSRPKKPASNVGWGAAGSAQVRPYLGHDRAPSSIASAQSSLVGALNALEGGAGVDLGNIPLELTSHLLYKEELTPSLHTLIHTQVSEEEPQALASS